MKPTVAAKLEAARDRLAALGRLTADLVAAHPEVFEDPELRKRLTAFEEAHAEAQERLARPRLSIAMIGTTSSGKSTIVNALVGRQIAPIEAGEMSGGVLTLRDADQRRVVVEPTEGAAWEAGEWTEIADKDAYDRIRNGVMRPYHDTRKERNCLAPQVFYEGPLLPARDDTLLELPTDLGIEFIDLPGLKSVQDRANLSVIQTRVHKAFSLVALDYLQTDEDHRKKLLEELVRVVKYLQGRTDSMIFVLNRVDQHGSDDEPVADRISLLRKEIREVLELNHEPDVLPFEARLLYRAQCAWGAASETHDHPEAPPELRLQHLTELFKECASTIERQIWTDESLDKWLQDVKRSVRKGQDVTPDEARRLLRLAREWSGGTKLWKRLRARIEESFAELVILPVLIEVFDTHHSLTGSLRTVSEIRKIDSKDQLERERERLEQVQMRLHKEVSATRERFRHRLTSAANGLKTGDQAVRHRLTKDLGPGFESLLSAVNEVTGDLNASLIAPVRDALTGNRGSYDLEEKLARVVAPSAAKDLARAYDTFSRRIPSLERKPGTLSARVRADDTDGVHRLEETERDARRLYQEMRKTIAGRAEFTLQGQATAVRDALTGLLDQQTNTIASTLRSELSDLGLDKAIESVRRGKTSADLLKLPSEFFTLPTAVDQRRHEQVEVVGQREETEHYTTGTCFKDKKTRTVIKNVMGTVAYQDLELPDEDGMARQWSDGVRGGEESLWETLRDWMIEALHESSVSFSSAIDSVLRLADRALEDQQRLAAGEYADVVARWEEIDGNVDRLEASLCQLLRAGTSKTN